MLIVDDHEDFRKSAKALLEAEGFAVVGEAVDGIEAIEAIATLRPSVVLLDIQLPVQTALLSRRALPVTPTRLP